MDPGADGSSHSGLSEAKVFGIHSLNNLVKWQIIYRSVARAKSEAFDNIFRVFYSGHSALCGG